MGCCTALVLAQRGARVTLFDRTNQLASRTSIHNEGKIHLGYVYAGDFSLATARMMICGALYFTPFLKDYLGLLPERIALSSPHVYLVHKNSQRSLDYLSGYFGAVHALIEDAAGGTKKGYFGANLYQTPRKWLAAEIDAVFNPAMAIAAFDTEELAVEPHALAQNFRERIAATPAIELRLRRTVQSVGSLARAFAFLVPGRMGWHATTTTMW